MKQPVQPNRHPPACAIVGDAPATGYTAIDYVVLTGAVLLMVVLRLHAFDAPLEVDECNYAYIGQRIAEGSRFYVDVWDHQPPGMYWYCGLLVRWFGAGAWVFRVSAAVAVAATLILVYAICRRALGRGSAAVAALLLAVVSSDPGIAGEGCNREIYMNAFGAAALWLVLDGRRWALLCAGLCLGVSSLFKTVVATQWLLLAGAVVIDGLWMRRTKPGALLGDVTLLGAGAALVWMVTAAVMRAGGRFESFVDATFIYNLGYGRIDVPLTHKLTGFFFGPHGFRVGVFRSAAGLWLAGACGVVLLPWRRDRRFALCVTALAVGSFLAVCLPGRFWNHYYMLMLVPLVVASAALVRGVFERWTRDRSGVHPPAILTAVLVVTASSALQWHYYLSLPPDRIASFRYHGRMAWARRQGRRVAKVTAPKDTIYVAGLDAGIYYYSGRRCASRYTMVTHLAGDDPRAARRRSELLDDLHRFAPRLILLINAPYIAELDRYIREKRFVKVGEDPGRMVVLCDPDRMIARIDWQDRPQISPPR